MFFLILRRHFFLMTDNYLLHVRRLTIVISQDTQLSKTIHSLFIINNIKAYSFAQLTVLLELRTSKSNLIIHYSLLNK